MDTPQDQNEAAGGQSRAGEAGANLTAVLERGLPEYVTKGFSRAEWHDKAWELYQAKKLDDPMLGKASIHTIRAVFDATFDALMEMKRSNKI